MWIESIYTCMTTIGWQTFGNVITLFGNGLWRESIVQRYQQSVASKPQLLFKSTFNLFLVLNDSGFATYGVRARAHDDVTMTNLECFLVRRLRQNIENKNWFHLNLKCTAHSLNGPRIWCIFDAHRNHTSIKFKTKIFRSEELFFAV